MKSPSRRFRGARKLGNAMSVAGTNARKTGDLFKAASHVVAKRMTLGAAAMSDPLNADHVEFAKIIPEKTRAFSEAGMAWLQWSGEVAAQMASFAASEMAAVAQATVAIASCRTPADAIARQSSFASAWFARSLSRSISLGSLAMRAQGAAMAPVHRVAAANARRLNR
jgi:Phasin protein